jgi:uncharacterized Zn finger protein
MVALVIHCPQCPDLQQGTGVSRERLKHMIETGEEITVMGSQCGHVWPISDQEKQNIRKALAEGMI